MSIKSTGGEAVANFTIENLQANTNTNINNINTTIPQTSDNTNILIYLDILLVSGICICTFIIKNQKSK